MKRETCLLHLQTCDQHVALEQGSLSCDLPDKQLPVPVRDSQSFATISRVDDHVLKQRLAKPRSQIRKFRKEGKSEPGKWQADGGREEEQWRIGRGSDAGSRCRNGCCLLLLAEYEQRCGLRRRRLVRQMEDRDARPSVDPHSYPHQCDRSPGSQKAT